MYLIYSSFFFLDEKMVVEFEMDIFLLGLLVS